MNIDINLIRRFRNKVKKNWNLPIDKFENLLDEIYPQFSISLFDDMSTLDFLSRYMEINKSAFETGEIKGIDTKFLLKLYDSKYELLKRWITKKKIEVESSFSYNLLMMHYKLKNWIDQDYQMEYLERNLAELDKVLSVEEYLGSEDNAAYHINTFYKNGEYPDIDKFKHHDISITLSLILFKQFLKEELSELISIKTKDQAFLIKGSFISEEVKEGNLMLRLPIQQIVELVKKEIKKESPKETKTEKKGVMKYYTTKQVCEMLQVSAQTLNQWRENGIIVAGRAGNKQIRYTEKDIQNAVKKINVIPFN